MEKEHVKDIFSYDLGFDKLSGINKIDP